MLKWREPLLVYPPCGEVERVRASCERGKPQGDYYLITLSETPGNRLEVLPCVYLRQRQLRERVPLIVGLARGRWAALQLSAWIELDYDCFIPGGKVWGLS